MQLVRFVQLEEFFCIKLAVFALRIELVRLACVRRRGRRHSAAARAIGVGERAYLLEVIVQDDQLFALEAQLRVLFKQLVTLNEKKRERLR